MGALAGQALKDGTSPEPLANATSEGEGNENQGLDARSCRALRLHLSGQHDPPEWNSRLGAIGRLRNEEQREEIVDGCSLPAVCCTYVDDGVSGPAAKAEGPGDYSGEYADPVRH